MNKKFSKIKLVTICLLFSLIFTLNQIVFGSELKDISSQVDKYVDFASISDVYKVHNATDGDDIQQITFINTQTRQRMSITFSKYLDALNETEMSNFIKKLRKDKGTGSGGGISSKITSFKSFYAHNQVIPYFNVNQYDNGKLWTKAMIGGIQNYNGKFILIQSYSSPESYDEQEMINFFSKLKIKTEEY